MAHKILFTPFSFERSSVHFNIHLTSSLIRVYKKKSKTSQRLYSIYHPTLLCFKLFVAFGKAYRGYCILLAAISDTVLC